MSDICVRIQKQTAGLQSKIDKLKTPRLTNTWKRQQEQRQRDRKIEQLTAYKQVLEYLEETACTRELTTFENALLTGAFYDTMRSYSVRKKYAEEKSLPNSCPAYPTAESDVWKRMQRAKIYSFADLMQAIADFNELYENATIPEDPKSKRLRDLIFAARLRQSGDIQFTSEMMAKKLLGQVALDNHSRVLEPEAGIGSLADEIRNVTSNIDCAEISFDFREVLRLKGYSVIGDSLFEVEPEPVYDAVLMNPPFSEECRHIQYASSFLKPGGTLASICSPRIMQSERKEYESFREWLSQYTFHTELVMDTDFEKTKVNTVILVLWK